MKNGQFGSTFSLISTPSIIPHLLPGEVAIPASPGRRGDKRAEERGVGGGPGPEQESEELMWSGRRRRLTSESGCNESQGGERGETRKDG